MKSIASRYWIAGWLLLATAGGAGHALAEDQISWTADFRTACGMAAEQHRLVLLHFYSDNCEWCVRLDQNVFSKPEVAEAVAQNYLAVKIHAGKQPQLASRYRVKAFPTDVFVTPSGLEVYRTVSQQKPADYIAVLNQVAQQTGVGAARQWKSQLSQAVQPAAAGAAAMANNVAGDVQDATQRASDQMQGVANQAQQRWGAAVNQFQKASDQARATAQQTVSTAQQTANAAQQTAKQATDAAQQTADTAKQWSQQASDAVERYEQQAGDSYRQFRDQAGQTGQQYQQQAQTARQEWRAAGQQTAQQFGETARDLKAQWQSATGDSPLDRRSAFVAPDPSPASEPAAAAVAAGPAAPQVATAAPASPSSATSNVAALPTENPFVTNREPQKSVTAEPAPAASAVETPAASSGMAPPSVAPPFVPAQPQSLAASPPSEGNPPLVPASQAPPIGLDGFCPVTLIETVARDPSDRSAWKKGDRKFGAIHRGRTYLFTSAENQQKFLANPDAFAPALAGCDPVRYTERGELLEGKRAYGLVTADKRIFLFADEASRDRFEQSPSGYTAALQQAMLRSESGSVYR